MSFHDLIAAYGSHDGDVGEGDASVVVEKERKSEEDGLGLVNYEYEEEKFSSYSYEMSVERRGDKFNEENEYYYSDDGSVGMGPDNTHSPSIYSPSNFVSNENAPLNDGVEVMSLIENPLDTNRTNYSSWKDDYPIDGVEVSPELLAIVTKFSNLRKTGGNINRDLRRQKNFKNPDLLGRLIKENNLIEIGSNYNEEMFNPFKWKSTSFVTHLAQEQAKILEEGKKKQELAKSRNEKNHKRKKP